MTHDIKYMKMPNYYNRDLEVLGEFEVTEKIDGSNFRWVFDTPDRIVFGSRKHMNILSVKILREENTFELFDNVGATLGKGGSGGSFKRYASFVAKKYLETNPDYFNPQWMDYVFYGENVGDHQIAYEQDPERMVVGFAVYDTISEQWLPNWKTIMHNISMPTVAVLKEFEGWTADQIWEWIQKQEDLKLEERQKSWYDGKSRIEGVVIADYKNQTFFKLKTKEFIETKMPKQAVSSWSRFVDKYATTQRIEKIVLKMKNDELGYNKKNPVSSLIGHLSKDVFEEADVNDIIKILRKELMPLFAQVIRTPEVLKITMRLKE